MFLTDRLACFRITAVPSPLGIYKPPPTSPPLPKPVPEPSRSAYPLKSSPNNSVALSTLFRPDKPDSVPRHGTALLSACTSVSVHLTLSSSTSSRACYTPSCAAAASPAAGSSRAGRPSRSGRSRRCRAGEASWMRLRRLPSSVRQVSRGETRHHPYEISSVVSARAAAAASIVRRRLVAVSPARPPPPLQRLELAHAAQQSRRRHRGSRGRRGRPGRRG